MSRASAVPVTGRAEASDERALRDQLRASGLLAVSVRPVHIVDALRAGLSRDRPRRADAAWFFRTLSMLLTSNVPAEAALANMAELAPRPRLARICLDVRERLRSGGSLAEAVEATPDFARPQHAALLRFGERSGRLAHIVRLIDQSITNAERIRRTIVGRLIYPAILLVAAVGAVWFLASFVLPRFAGTLMQLGGELPWQTRATLAVADVAVWAAPTLALVGLALFAARDRLITPALRARVSRLALRTPVVGSLLWHAHAAVITDVLATTLEGGGDVLTGLAQAHSVVGSPEVAARLDAARADVRAGADVGQALREHRVLPPMVTAAVAVGSRSGELVPALRRGTELALERQDTVGARLMALMEPALILFLAGAVGWVVYSLIAGMLAMTEVAGG
jgi:general secretion pathway protein F